MLALRAGRFFSSSTAEAASALPSLLRKEHRFVQAELSEFAGLSGDSNPIHTDASAAACAGFSACVVPGMLCASLFCSLISAQFPGAIYEAKNLRFKEPALVGDCLTAEAKVLALRPGNHGLSIDLSMECYKKDTKVMVLEGTSTITVPSK